MSPRISVIFDGKKFMWDGRIYGTRDEASTVGDSYRNDKFEIQLLEENGGFLLYTRRVVKESVTTIQ